MRLRRANDVGMRAREVQRSDRRESSGTIRASTLPVSGGPHDCPLTRTGIILPFRGEGEA